MLNRRLGILALGLGLLASVGYAQRKPVQKPAAMAAKKPAVPAELVTLSTGQAGGPISRDAFMKEMSKPLMTNGRVDGFSFMYGERNMYEDSAGNPLPVIDYLTQFCYGDTLPEVIKTRLLERAKPGDTIYYDRIRVRKADGSEVPGKPMKFTFTP